MDVGAEGSSKSLAAFGASILLLPMKVLPVAFCLTGGTWSRLSVVVCIGIPISSIGIRFLMGVDLVSTLVGIAVVVEGDLRLVDALIGFAVVMLRACVHLSRSAFIDLFAGSNANAPTRSIDILTVQRQ